MEDLLGCLSQDPHNFFQAPLFFPSKKEKRKSFKTFHQLSLQIIAIVYQKLEHTRLNS